MVELNFATLQDINQRLVAGEMSASDTDTVMLLIAPEPCSMDSLRHSWVNKWAPKPGDIRSCPRVCLDCIFVFGKSSAAPPRQHLHPSLCPKLIRNVLNR